MKLEVYNSALKNPIYTTQVYVVHDEQRGRYEVYRSKDDKFLGASTMRLLALEAACQKVLKGFHKPGIYHAAVDGMPYAWREVKQEGDGG